jgi:hypothetical protein
MLYPTVNKLFIVVDARERGKAHESGAAGRLRNAFLSSVNIFTARFSLDSTPDSSAAPVTKQLAIFHLLL